MALSDYEKQVLAEMEAELRREDPDLVSQMGRGRPASGSAAPAAPALNRGKRARILVGSALLVLVGLFVVVAGVSMGYSLVSLAAGVLGFVMMVIGILAALRALTARQSQSFSSRRTRGGCTDGGLWARFMADQERRWDERDER